MGIVTSRFGQDAPARIAASTPMLMEATEMYPNEWLMPNLIPFPSLLDVPAAGLPDYTIVDGNKVWNRYPARCDLVFYQGDDVVIPIYLADPADLDMSDQSQWEWNAQVRQLHDYRSALVHTFITDASYTPPADADSVGITTVKMYLPRSENIIYGIYAWELFSVSPFDATGFDEPLDWVTDHPDEPWPPTTTLRTWLWGLCTIRRRGSVTDTVPGALDTSGGGLVPTAVFVGPNGRVP